MKKTLALMTVLLVIATLSACKELKDTIIPQTPQNPTQSQAPAEQQSPARQQTISKERAIELALKEAGVDKASAFDIEAELEVKRDGTFWEVDFETRDHEYSYDINAVDGTVTKAEREREFNN